MEIKDIVILVVVIAIILAIVVAVRKIVRSIKRTVRSVSSTINSVGNIIEMVKDVEESEPDIKSISGATSVYLPKIQADFPDFHAAEAETAIKNYVIDYISNLGGKDIVFNKVAISNYQKTLDYATIEYRVSVGYKNPNMIQTRYKLKYTYKLIDNRGSLGIKCPNCGAVSSGRNKNCEYCGIEIITDTIINWVVTEIEEN